VIVSFEHNFIFIKTRKTAGTSIEIALSPYAGKNGVITPISGEDETTRYRLYPDALPQNYTDDNREEEEKYREAIRESVSQGTRPRSQRSVAGRFKFYNHMPAKRARASLDEAFWNKAFKFTVERHPYEKAVSMAYFRRKNKSRVDVETLLDKVVERGDYNNYRLYAIDGVIAADFVVRFERLTDDLREVERRLAIDIVSRVPDAKSSFRSDRRPAKEILSERQKSIIRERCRDEFNLFGYEE